MENFIELLLEANDEIQKTLKAGNTAQAMELLAQCQEGAVKAGKNRREKTSKLFAWMCGYEKGLVMPMLSVLRWG